MWFYHLLAEPEKHFPCSKNRQEINNEFLKLSCDIQQTHPFSKRDIYCLSTVRVIGDKLTLISSVSNKFTKLKNLSLSF